MPSSSSVETKSLTEQIDAAASKGVIDLPDVYGRPGMDQHNFRVYEEILSTIERYGKVLDDTDIIGDKEARING